MEYKNYTEEKKEKSREACRKWAAKNDRSKYYKMYEGKRGKRAARVSYKMWWNAKKRAAEAALPFSIQENDIVLSHVCPCCGGFMGVIEGVKGGSARSWTLDRIKPALGYVKGNVAVICKECNSQKGNASPEQLRRIADWIEEMTG